MGMKEGNTETEQKKNPGNLKGRGGIEGRKGQGEVGKRQG